MKKIFAMTVIAIASMSMNAKHTTEKSHEVAYFVSGSNVYHRSAVNAREHTIMNGTTENEGKVLMQLRKGCEDAHQHKCMLCYGFHLVNK